MSIGALSLSVAPIAGQAAIPEKRKPPPKRQIIAKTDLTAAPEPR